MNGSGGTHLESVERTGGQALVAQLIAEGVVDVFGIPGVQLDWAVDALREESERIRFIVARHEQAASYMADGYARTTQREGVCMVVPGPGMLNALSGIATAYACNSPVLFLVGQIPSAAIGAGFGLLHEIPDQSAILKSLTKWHALARSPEEIPALIHQAFVQLRSDRPRPVAIELPPDVLQARTRVSLLTRAGHSPLVPRASLLDQAAAILSEARSPAIYAGGGAARCDAGQALQALAERLQAPVVMSEGGRGLIDDRHALALAPLGGRALLPHADVILVAGSRFVDGIAKPIHAHPKTKYVYLNVDAAQMAAPRPPGLELLGDARLGFEGLLARINTESRLSAAHRVAKIRAWCLSQFAAIEPQMSFVRAIRAAAADDDIIVSELTQIGYFANISFPVYKQRRYITPGYQGTLGYGFNTALGAAYGNPAQRVISLNGDGGFGWGLPELATVARDRPNLSIIVFVDGHFGNVRRIQQRTFGKTYGTELTNPNFSLLTRAYDIPFVSTDSAQGLELALKEATKRGGPALVAVGVPEMPSPWSLIHSFVPPPGPVPPNPLGDPIAFTT